MKFNIILFAFSFFIISACGNRNQESKQKQEPQPQNQVHNDSSKPATTDPHPGKKVYDSVCLACHMADGSGVPGMFPPLIKTDWVTGSKERLIQITLQGLSGKIEVNGVTYNSIMPPNSHLSDKQVADVLSYIRQSFGNNSDEITVEEVQKVRKSL